MTMTAVSELKNPLFRFKQESYWSILNQLRSRNSSNRVTSDQEPKGSQAVSGGKRSRPGACLDLAKEARVRSQRYYMLLQAGCITTLLPNTVELRPYYSCQQNARTRRGGMAQPAVQQNMPARRRNSRVVSSGCQKDGLARVVGRGRFLENAPAGN